MGLCKAKLPRHAGVLYGSQWRCAGAAIMTRNHQVIGFCLGDAGCNGANTDLRAQLDTDSSTGIGIFEIVNELGHILNRVDVVMRRGAD